VNALEQRGGMANATIIELRRNQIVAATAELENYYRSAA
jgi:hypothetical protein